MSLSFSPKYYFKPKTESEVSDLLKKFGDKARLIAGGTGIYEIAHRGLISDVEVLIDLNGTGLAYIDETDPSRGRIKVGACTTLSGMAKAGFFKGVKSSPSVQAIGDALVAIQPLQVKNVATIGGAICTALPFFDLPVALLSLDSNVVIAPSGRKMRLEDFILGYFATSLSEGEFVREVEIPLYPERVGSAFLKFGVTGDDWALINSGVQVALSSAGKIEKVRMFFGGGVGERPKRVSQSENKLLGLDSKDEDGIKAALDEALASELETVSDIRASAQYRMKLAKVLGRRSVLKACERASQGRAGL